MKWMSRAALEYIGQGGLGHSFQALDEAKTDTFSEAIKLLRSASTLLSKTWFRNSHQNI